MCIIVDTNRLNLFLTGRDGSVGDPIRRWVGFVSRKDGLSVGLGQYRRRGSKNIRGKLVYSTGGPFKTETLSRAKARLAELRVAGGARLVPWRDIKPVAERLEDEQRCISNDCHVLALAIVSGAKVLYSDDQNLRKDFKNKEIVNGYIYSNEAHAHLLRKAACRS